MFEVEDNLIFFNVDKRDIAIVHSNSNDIDQGGRLDSGDLAFVILEHLFKFTEVVENLFGDYVDESEISMGVNEDFIDVGDWMDHALDLILNFKSLFLVLMLVNESNHLFLCNYYQFVEE